VSTEEHEGEFTPEQQLEAELAGLTMSWQELGIDPDDFIKCALCHEFMFDPDNDFQPREHCQKTVYVIKTASGILHARVRSGNGAFEAADREARRIHGLLFGVSVEGKEIPLAAYNRA
jgi:hypothetical protein